jgi:hypothetical protein
LTCPSGVICTCTPTYTYARAYTKKNTTVRRTVVTIRRDGHLQMYPLFFECRPLMSMTNSFRHSLNSFAAFGSLILPLSQLFSALLPRSIEHAI